MKTLLPLALLLLSAPSAARSTDTVITRAKHTDAANVMGQDQPAQDSTEVIWIGAAKDRVRSEEGKRVTIVRTDLAKMYVLDTEAKTYSTLDLPVDLKKFMPADMAPRMEQLLGEMKVTVTPTAETKQVDQWNATRYTVAVTLPMGPSTTTQTQEMWVTKDIGIDPAAWHALYANLTSTHPIKAGMGAKMKEVDGFPVLIESTQSVMGSTIKTTEKVVSVEQKEPAAGLYDPPQDYTAKPFDPMSEMRMGPPGGRSKRGG